MSQRWVKNMQCFLKPFWNLQNILKSLSVNSVSSGESRSHKASLERRHWFSCSPLKAELRLITNVFIVIYKLKGTLETQKVVKDYDWKFLTSDQLGRIFLFCCGYLVSSCHILVSKHSSDLLTTGSCGENSCDLATAAGVSSIMKFWEEAEVGRTWCHIASEFHES